MSTLKLGLWMNPEMQNVSNDNMLSFIEYLNEGVNDPAIFKAVFLSGGPGSGKSFTVGKNGAALAALGFRVVNSDTAFENAMKKAGMEMNADNIFSAQGQNLRAGAVELTGKQKELYITGRLGLVIDGTGRDAAKILRQKAEMEQLGYETAMVFVNTDLETAINRDAKRGQGGRSLGSAEVTVMWKSVQRNIGTFQSAFGSNFYVVDNSEGSNFKSDVLRIFKQIGRWSKRDPKNRIAQAWIRQQKSG